MNALSMVWKTNLYRISKTDILVENKQKELEGFLTFEGFMCEVFGDFYDFSSKASFKDPKEVFRIGLHLDEKHFPKHIIFGNFQCLRCGLCCKNYNDVTVPRALISRWQRASRSDLLKHVDLEMREIYSEPSWLGCKFCRKVRNKPYYSCKVNSFKEFMPVCKTYLCSKSTPVAHLDFKDIDDLIELIGLSAYYGLIETDWNEDFDYSKCKYKTHKRQG